MDIRFISLNAWTLRKVHRLDPDRESKAPYVNKGWNPYFRICNQNRANLILQLWREFHFLSSIKFFHHTLHQIIVRSREQPKTPLHIIRHLCTKNDYSQTILLYVIFFQLVLHILKFIQGMNFPKSHSYSKCWIYMHPCNHAWKLFYFLYHSKWNLKLDPKKHRGRVKELEAED